MFKPPCVSNLSSLGRRSSGLRTLSPTTLSVIALLSMTAALIAPAPLWAAVFEVNDKTDFADANPGDGVCDTGNLRINAPPFLVVPECTFRAALEEANALPGLDEIRFGDLIPLSSIFAEITPQSAYPAIVDPVIIDGYSHPNYETPDPEAIPMPTVALVGNSVPTNSNGLEFHQGSDGSTLLGLAIHAFPFDGVVVKNTSDITLQGNHLGVSRGGFMVGNGATGINVASSASGTTIGKRCSQTLACLGRGNLISANAGTGVIILGSDNRIAGNYIGTDQFGILDSVPFGGATGNGGAGVIIASGSNNEVGSLGALNLGGIGGPIPAASGNIISSNGGEGISVLSMSSGTSIKANKIGTDRNGNLLLANGSNAILLEGEATIGDSDIGGNQIVGNGNGSNPRSNPKAGIFSLGEVFGSSYPVSIVGNLIGVNAAGSEKIGDLDLGIILFQNTGKATIDDNLIGGGFGGVAAGRADLRRNWLGTNPAGDDLGFADIALFTGSDSVVGGSLTDSASMATANGNVIANSGAAGIILSGYAGVDPIPTSAPGAIVRGNVFQNIAGLPIDLTAYSDAFDPQGSRFAEGATPNDTGDDDLGGNQLQNFPEFDAAQTSYDDVALELTVRIRVDSLTTSSAYPLLVDLYESDPLAAPAEQAGRLVGSVAIEASDAGQYVTRTFTPLAGSFVPDPTTGAIDSRLFATATDADGNTSEYSRQNVPVPEPGLAICLAFGALGIASARRRRH